jgi:hypothetical protein
VASQRVDGTGVGEVAYLCYGVVAICSAGKMDSRSVGIVRIAFTALRAGHPVMDVVHTDGSGETRLVN